MPLPLVPIAAPPLRCVDRVSRQFGSNQLGQHGGRPPAHYPIRDWTSNLGPPEILGDRTKVNGAPREPNE
jgi:hypothetical protein